MILKPFLAVCIISTFCTSLFSQQKYSIDYYGIVAEDVDDNMSKMTSEFYYNQLCEINSYTVEDKRSGIKMQSLPSTADFSDDKLSLYAVISKKENSSKWISTISLFDSSRKAIYSEAKEYDSYYKILMEPKASLQETITSLMSGNSIAQSSQTEDSASTSKSSTKIQSTEILSGTWGGEDSIDKIVIMRGGRGFVIFNNGASMNITVELSGNEGKKQVLIKQKGNSNASFYPELKRTAALSAAVSANPIKWTLTLTDSNTLKGTKDTLIPDGDNYKEGSVSVTWTRLN